MPLASLLTLLRSQHPQLPPAQTPNHPIRSHESYDIYGPDWRQPLPHRRSTAERDPTPTPNTPLPDMHDSETDDFSHDGLLQSQLRLVGLMDNTTAKHQLVPRPLAPENNPRFVMNQHRVSSSNVVPYLSSHSFADSAAHDVSASVCDSTAESFTSTPSTPPTEMLYDYLQPSTPDHSSLTTQEPPTADVLLLLDPATKVLPTASTETLREAVLRLHSERQECMRIIDHFSPAIPANQLNDIKKTARSSLPARISSLLQSTAIKTSTQRREIDALKSENGRLMGKLEALSKRDDAAPRARVERRVMPVGHLGTATEIARRATTEISRLRLACDGLSDALGEAAGDEGVDDVAVAVLTDLAALHEMLLEISALNEAEMVERQSSQEEGNGLAKREAVAELIARNERLGARLRAASAAASAARGATWRDTLGGDIAKKPLAWDEQDNVSAGVGTTAGSSRTCVATQTMIDGGVAG